MVANSIQNLPAFVDSGQHSIVTAPVDTGPSPRMRNLILRGSGSTSLLPAPVVALSCRAFSTLIIAFFYELLWILDQRWATVYHLGAGHHPRLGPGSGSLLHAGAGFLVGTSRWPSLSLCKGATKIVRPSRSTVAAQPQLQPTLLRFNTWPRQLQNGPLNRAPKMRHVC
jgi:hypothetical protein